jgi:hypothetical protein
LLSYTFTLQNRNEILEIWGQSYQLFRFSIFFHVSSFLSLKNHTSEPCEFRDYLFGFCYNYMKI